MNGAIQVERFDTALVLTRVLTSGVVMSIERRDCELPGLERVLTRQSGRSAAVLLNSRSAAVHAALVGLGVGHGDKISGAGLDRRTRSFVNWLGVTLSDEGPAAFDQIALTPENAGRLSELATAASNPALVLDLTGLGFGPAAAFLTDVPLAAARAERLKIFGTYDLRTMWTQTDAEPALVPGVQFNYRLSPLVAACVRATLARTAPISTTGASA